MLIEQSKRLQEQHQHINLHFIVWTAFCSSSSQSSFVPVFLVLNKLALSSASLFLSCIHTFYRHICRKYLKQKGNTYMFITCMENKATTMKSSFLLTCKEGHEHGHPAQYVGPGEAPVTKTSPQEVDSHSSVNGHTQKNKESWKG